MFLMDVQTSIDNTYKLYNFLDARQAQDQLGYTTNIQSLSDRIDMWQQCKQHQTFGLQSKGRHVKSESWESSPRFDAHMLQANHA